MLELTKSQRFQEEYRQYQSKIEAINNVDLKNQATTAFKILVNEVKKLDNQHQEMFSGNQIPMGLGDARNNIISLRKKLDNLLKNSS
jgi:hypothetical protein